MTNSTSTTRTVMLLISLIVCLIFITSVRSDEYKRCRIEKRWREPEPCNGLKARCDTGGWYNVEVCETRVEREVTDKETEINNKESSTSDNERPDSEERPGDGYFTSTTKICPPDPIKEKRRLSVICRDPYDTCPPTRPDWEERLKSNSFTSPENDAVSFFSKSVTTEDLSVGLFIFLCCTLFVWVFLTIIIKFVSNASTFFCDLWKNSGFFGLRKVYRYVVKRLGDSRKHKKEMSIADFYKIISYTVILHHWLLINLSGWPRLVQVTLSYLIIAIVVGLSSLKFKRKRRRKSDKCRKTKISFAGTASSADFEPENESDS